MVDGVQNAGNTPDKFQIKTKADNTDTNGKVNNAKTKQTINIFSSYDSDKNETVNNKDKNFSSLKNSIFANKESALETRLGGYNLPDTLNNKSNKPQIKDYLSQFETKVNNYTFGVGKLVRQIMVKEGKEADSQKLQIEQQGSAQLDNKVNMDATQKANSYMSDIEDAYKKALEEFVKNNSQKTQDGQDANGVNDTNKDVAHSDHNTENDANAKVKKVEVFSDYDGNADKHVTYGEIDGAGTFKYSATQNFGIDTNTQYGQFLDEASNYDVEANFNRYATGFDAKVGSTKLKGDDTAKVKAAKAELNTKATREAEKFNEEITLKVQKEKFEALDKAIKASSNDPSKYDNYIKGLEEEVAGEGAVLEDEVEEKTKLPEEYKPTSPKSEGYKTSGKNPTEQLLNGTLDKLFEFITPDESDSESKVENNDTFDKNKFERYKKMGLSMTLASYMADSANGVTPAGYKNGKITHVSVQGQDNNKITMSVEELEDFIKKQRQQKKTAGQSS